MGLDVTAYENVELVKAGPYNEDFEDFTHLDQNEYFPDHADGLVSGHYKVSGESHGFRAGSYSGYNQFRDSLSMALMGASQNHVWSNQAEFKDKPGFMLACFSDCEGIIGPKTSKRLYDELTANRDKYFAANADDYYRQKYDEWIEAFRIASVNGVVDFH